MKFDFDTTEKFYKQIPKEMSENIDFRKNLHSYLEKDEEAQKDFIQLCLLDPRIAFSAAFWTANPRGEVGKRNFPFILRPKQEEVVTTLHKCIINQEDMGINKSRDEGATEIVTKVFALHCFVEESYFIVGSRNKVLVDCLGDPFTLMAKVDYAFKTMPYWMQQMLGPIDRKEMQLAIPKFSTVIKGETTNENFAAGRRATAMLLDEFGRVDQRIAKSIEGSVHDVTGCVVYGSTHWYGANHPFQKALDKKSTHVVELPWWENPTKNYGLYKSPDYDVIEIVDVDYYHRTYPRLKPYLTDEPFKLSVLERELLASGYDGDSPRFIADKCENLPEGADLRSPWHDKEEEKRSGNFRDFASNIWMSPIGAQDSFFNKITLSRMKTRLYPAKIAGELHVEYDGDGRLKNQWFQENAGKKRLKWWGQLKNNRPFQNRNYVIGCDLSYGSGNSNSVAAIYDVNLQALVGTWVCPNTPPDEFMDIVVGLARWVGGASGEALIIYESNGPGVNAHKRLKFQHHSRIYVQRTEEAKLKQTQNKYGWRSNPQSKEALLGNLGTALSEGLKTQPEHKSCLVYDPDTYDELVSYMFYENGDIGCSEFQDLSSGARARHGDRVIALGLCVLGSQYQNRVKKVAQRVPKFGSFAWRQQEEERKKQANKNERRFWY